MSGDDADASCVVCPVDKFCPMHTNRQFSCPANTKVLTALGASADGIQRLLSLASPDAYCKADAGGSRALEVKCRGEISTTCHADAGGGGQAATRRAAEKLRAGA